MVDSTSAGLTKSSSYGKDPLRKEENLLHEICPNGYDRQIPRMVVTNRK